MLEAVGIVFALVAIGYGLAWGRIVGEGFGEALGSFVFTVAIPVLLFRTLANATFDGTAALPFWTAYFVPVAITWTVASVVIRRGFARDARAGVVGGLSSGFSNTVLVGIPLILAVYGEPGFALLTLLLAVHLPLMMAASVILFDLAERRDGVAQGGLDARGIARRFAAGMARNPIVIGILAGVAWRLAGLELPGFAARLVDQIASIAGTLALLSLGMSLRRFGIARNVGQGLTTAVLKLTAMPALATAFALVLALPPLAAQIVVVTAAMPTGVNPYLIASRFGTGEALASNTMIVSTAAAPVTLAFWLWAAQAIF